MKLRLLTQVNSSTMLPKLIVPGAILTVFWLLGILLWLVSQNLEVFLHFGYLGLILATGIGTWFALPKTKKTTGRKITIALLGSYLLFLTVSLGLKNVQTELYSSYLLPSIEGFFFSLFAGLGTSAFYHYLVGKIVSPLLIGRFWCGWACWTAMLFDWLPFKRDRNDNSGKGKWFRYAHFFLSLGLIVVVWFGFNYGTQLKAEYTGLIWFLIGNLLYYLVGVMLAFILKDNRAFCKYLCPNAVLFKLTSRYAPLKIEGDANQCFDCGNACSKICPMDVNVADYIRSGRRVTNTDCSLCQSCIYACPHDALKISFSFSDKAKLPVMQTAPSQPSRKEG
jgi:ferredoxin-type protein NapH